MQLGFSSSSRSNPSIKNRIPVPPYQPAIHFAGNASSHSASSSETGDSFSSSPNESNSFDAYSSTFQEPYTPRFSADNKQQRLLKAIEQNATDSIYSLYDLKMVDINKADQNGVTPLIHAAEHGQASILRALLECGADPNAESDDHRTALLAATSAHSNTIRALMDFDTNVDQSNQLGTTPLMQATINGNLPAAKLLLQEYNANPNLTDQNGDTALIHAVKSENTELVNLLLEANASTSIKNKQGKTALDIARGYNQQGVITLLEKSQKAQTSYSYIYQAGNRPTEKPRPDKAATQEENDNFVQAASDGDIDELSKLFKKNINLNHLDSTGKTALHNTIINGKTEVFDSLLGKKELDINKPDNTGKTPLFYASLPEHPYYLNHLLKLKPRLDQADENGLTPLMAAASMGNLDALNSLQYHGATLEAKDKDKWTPLIFAANKGQTEAIKLLLSRGASIEPKDDDGLNAIHHAIAYSMANNNDKTHLTPLLEAKAKADNGLSYSQVKTGQKRTLWVTPKAEASLKRLNLEVPESLGVEYFPKVKSAWKKLSLKYHPDKSIGQPEVIKKQNRTKIQEINAAYEDLETKINP